MTLSAIVIIVLCVALSAALFRLVSLRQEHDALEHGLASAVKQRVEIQAERDLLAKSFENAMKRTPAEAMDIVAKRHAFWENIATESERAPTAGGTEVREAAGMNLPDPFEHHVVDPRDVRHPFQMIVRDEDRVLRFKANNIIRHLTNGELNDLSGMDFPREDWEQLAQLTGYSLDEFLELGCVSNETRLAVEQAKANFKQEL